MNSGGSLGELFVWDRDTEAPKAVESYRGKKLRQLASSNDQLVALDGEGKLTWLKGEPVSDSLRITFPSNVFLQDRSKHSDGMQCLEIYVYFCI